jgi:DNA invertase Pin-like site-specific DNA recombinase
VLEAPGCDKIFVEHASATLAKRPALTDALSYLRDGDTFVVTKLDRLGRSVRNLKHVAYELRQRGIGLMSQGIDTTTPGAGCSSTCWRQLRSSSTTSSSSAP